MTVLTLNLINRWLKRRSLPLMSWCRPECAYILLEKKQLPKLVEDCEQLLLPNGFIFQEDGAPAYTARVTQNWLKSNCSDFITKLKQLTQFTHPPVHPISVHCIITFGGNSRVLP